MARFRFRLQRVLDYRLRLEEKAERQYAEAHHRRIVAERRLTEMNEERLSFLHRPDPFSLDAARLRTLYLEAFQDRIERQSALVEVTRQEERERRDAWLAARRERQTLDNLRARAKAEFDLYEGRRMQAELDEWAVQRRAA